MPLRHFIGGGLWPLWHFIGMRVALVLAAVDMVEGLQPMGC